MPPPASAPYGALVIEPANIGWTAKGVCPHGSSESQIFGTSDVIAELRDDLWVSTHLLQLHCECPLVSFVLKPRGST